MKAEAEEIAELPMEIKVTLRKGFVENS